MKKFKMENFCLVDIKTDTWKTFLTIIKRYDARGISYDIYDTDENILTLKENTHRYISGDILFYTKINEFKESAKTFFLNNVYSFFHILDDTYIVNTGSSILFFINGEFFPLTLDYGLSKDLINPKVFEFENRELDTYSGFHIRLIRDC